jgi:dTDP-glucose 4,6-dehydratase
MKKTAVVTGGAGFIGSHLCQRLIKEGFRVLCLDNLITGTLENIERLSCDKNFSFIKHNVTSHIDIKGRVDFCLHFASPASPEDYLRFPIQTLKVGSLGTHNVLGLAKSKKAKFVLASTSEIYGDPLKHPQQEDYWGNVNCIGVRGCYDEAKRFAEAITMAYHRVHKIDTRIIRIFNTYGPRMRIHDGRVVPNFLDQALSGEPITIYGRGMQTRSFCYVDDLVEGIFKVMCFGVNQPINLGNPREFTVLELAKLVLKLTSSRSKIVFKPLPQDDPKKRKPDIFRAQKILNWEPKINLEEGLSRTIAWLRKRFP